MKTLTEQYENMYADPNRLLIVLMQDIKKTLESIEDPSAKDLFLREINEAVVNFREKFGGAGAIESDTSDFNTLRDEV